MRQTAEGKVVKKDSSVTADYVHIAQVSQLWPKKLLSQPGLLLRGSL